MAQGSGVQPGMALLGALRRPEDEVQATTTLAAAAHADASLAKGMLKSLLGLVSSEHQDALRRLGAPVGTVRCRAETRFSRVESGTDRVDLLFDDEAGLRLLVECQLRSGYGDHQIKRYLAHLTGSRDGLVSVAPLRLPGLDRVQHEQWLGVVRWSDWLPPLRGLDCENPQLAAQWPLFIDVLKGEEVMGLGEITDEAVRGWGRARLTQGRLRGVLNQIADETRRLIEDVTPDAGVELIEFTQAGPTKVGVDFARLEYRLHGYPAPRLWVWFQADPGEGAHFKVEVRVEGAPFMRPDRSLEPQARQVHQALSETQIETDGATYWRCVHPLNDGWSLEGERGAGDLIVLLEQDLPALAGAGLLAPDRGGT